METAETVVLSLEFAATELLLQRHRGDVLGRDRDGEHGEHRPKQFSNRSLETCWTSEAEAWKEGTTEGPDKKCSSGLGARVRGGDRRLSPSFLEGPAAGPLCNGLCTRAPGSPCAGLALVKNPFRTSFESFRWLKKLECGPSES